MLKQFFNHTETQIEQFHRAVEEFQARIPELARGLLQRVHDERGDNPTFVAAFNQFHDLCKNALNPSISAAAIEEMLVQHLLTGS